MNITCRYPGALLDPHWCCGGRPGGAWGGPWVEIISIRNGAIYLFVFAFVIAFIYLYLYLFLYISSPGGPYQVWHCWVPQIHEQQDKDHRRWPFWVSLEAVSKSIATLTISSQPGQYQPPCAHWTWATTNWWNCPSTHSVKPKPSTGLICMGELTIKESICHDFVRELFHNNDIW